MQAAVSKLARRQVFGTTLVCSSLGAAAYYYRDRWVPQKYAAAPSTLQPPVRRTTIFTAGDGAVIEEKHKYHPFVFKLYSIFRLWLLCFRVVPVCWYLFLSHVGLCPLTFAYEALHDMLVAMGSTYIKLGQWLASRPDIFPPDLCHALSKLFDNAPPHAWASTEAALRDGDVLRHLASIETVPLNSGSVAQVHRGILRDDVDGIPAGTAVAVKVLHPHIREQIAADIAAMRMMINAVEAVVPGAVYFDGQRALSEFSSLIQSQLDLQRECDNLLQFRYNFRDFDGVVFPAPAPSITTRDVLVETFEEGVPLHAFDHRNDPEGACLADIGCHMFLKMLFEDNFTHADLHGGNLLVRRRKERRGPWWQVPASLCSQEIVVLDPGLAVTLSPIERENFIALFGSVACGDGKLAAELMLDRSRNLRKECNREEFVKSIQSVVEIANSNDFKLSDVDFGAVLTQVLTAVRVHGGSIDGNFASIVVSVIIGEALGRSLAPDLNIFAASAPYMMRYLEGTELSGLIEQLRQKYGAASLVKNTWSIYQAPAYVGVAQARVFEIMDWVQTPVVTLA